MKIDSDKLLEIINARVDHYNRPDIAVSDSFRRGFEYAMDSIKADILTGELAAKKVYARAPVDCPRYFTAGKDYEVLFETDDEHIFVIIDDEGDEVSCDWSGDIQDSSRWERVEK